VGHGLVVDETLILVAGLICFFVLATGTRLARRPRARVTIGDEEEGAGASCRGER
jgi:hypothetical protein